MTMANLNPNGISGPAQPPTPAPAMGIMAMMSAAVPPPVGVLPTSSATSSSTSKSEVQQPQMTSNLVLANNNIRRKSSSPNVALINVTNPGSHIIEFFFRILQ